MWWRAFDLVLVEVKTFSSSTNDFKRMIISKIAHYVDALLTT
jgi:hypothetical protein